jgi:hypothetical protein
LKFSFQSNRAFFLTVTVYVVVAQSEVVLVPPVFTQVRPGHVTQSSFPILTVNIESAVVHPKRIEIMPSTWEKELVKKLEVTWGDARAILQIAKDELGIDQKDYPEESKDEIFAKCEEVVESFDKTPKVSLKPPSPPREDLKASGTEKSVPAAVAVTVGGSDEEEQAEPGEQELQGPSWEKDLVKLLQVTWGDAKAILAIAKDELGIDQKDYPEESKDEIFAKCEEVVESFDKTPKVSLKPPSTPREDLKASGTEKSVPAAIAVTVGGSDEEEQAEPREQESHRPSWERDLVKLLQVTWGDARAILEIAKDELGIDQKDYPEDSKDEVFDKCKEVAETFAKQPQVSLKPREDLVIAAVGKSAPEPYAWEDEIKDKYKCSFEHATTLLRMAKQELELDEMAYPDDKKALIFAKVKELSENFEFSTREGPATIVFVKDPWADELSNELNCRITNAKQLLVLAKRELNLSEDKPAPESMKEEVMEKAREIAETYHLTPKDFVAKADDDNRVSIAVVIVVIVVAAIVGVAVGISRKNKRNNAAVPPSPSTLAPSAAPESTDAPTVAVTSGGPGTNLPVDCEQVEMEFSVPSLAVAMAVSSDITDVEINYAAAVFQRTYVALVRGLAEDLPDFCDPFCRYVADVEVVSSEIIPVEDSSFAEEGCDSELEIVFDVTGTFVGCPDTEFPGLFGTSPLRQLYALTSETAARTTSLLRGNSVRRLQESEQLCGSCPDDSSSLGNVVPTEDEMIEIMDPLLSILPNVCALTDIVDLETGDDEIQVNSTAVGEGPPEGGWTPIDCVVSLSSDNCASFLESDAGIVPCSCDGQCIQYVNGEFFGCNDSGRIGDGVEGEITINAAGCTFAQHAAELVGFTCFE